MRRLGIGQASLVEEGTTSTVLRTFRNQNCASDAFIFSQRSSHRHDMHNSQNGDSTENDQLV